MNLCRVTVYDMKEKPGMFINYIPNDSRIIYLERAVNLYWTIKREREEMERLTGKLIEPCFIEKRYYKMMTRKVTKADSWGWGEAYAFQRGYYYIPAKRDKEGFLIPSGNLIKK